MFELEYIPPRRLTVDEYKTFWKRFKVVTSKRYPLGTVVVDSTVINLLAKRSCPLNKKFWYKVQNTINLQSGKRSTKLTIYREI